MDLKMCEKCGRLYPLEHKEEKCECGGDIKPILLILEDID